MPHSVSAAKRTRQAERRRLRNKSARSSIRTGIKKLRALVAAGNVEEARAAFKTTEKQLDQAAASGVFHKNTTSRYKSRLAHLISRASAPKA